MSEKKVLVKIPSTSVKEVEIGVEGGNPKVTRFSATPITKVVESEYNGKKYLWPNGDAFCEVERSGSRMQGLTYTIRTNAPYLKITYSTGSWKNTYESFNGLYDVTNDRWVFKIGKTEEVGRKEFNKVKAKLVNSPYTLSNSRPFSNIIAYYLLQKHQGEDTKRGEAKALIKRAVALIGLEEVKMVLNEKDE
ncbi:MAG: hypothetical protein ACTSX6_10425 [Candidatus Heimdallarchaeaceae archaeon]